MINAMTKHLSAADRTWAFLIERADLQEVAA
jgi:hypothetical protein